MRTRTRHVVSLLRQHPNPSHFCLRPNSLPAETKRQCSFHNILPSNASKSAKAWAVVATIRQMQPVGQNPPGPSSSLASLLLVRLPGHRRAASMHVAGWCWRGQKRQNKSDMSSGAGSTWWWDQSHYRRTHMALSPPLILLRAVSVQDSFRGKFQLVLKAHHLGVVLA